MTSGQRHRIIVVSTALAGALGAATEGMAPTGSAAIDAVECAVLGGAVAVAAVSCPWWLLVAAAMIGTLVAPTGVVTAVVVGGGLSAMLSAIRRMEARPEVSVGLRGVAGAALVFAFCRIRVSAFHGASAFVAGAVFAVLVSVALGRARRWRRASLVAALTGLAAGLAGGLFLLGGLATRDDLNGAKVAAERALDEVRAGDFPRAKSSLAIATASFRRADRRLRHWSVAPAAAVPFVGRYRAALVDLTRAGRRLGDNVGRTLGEVDLDRLKPRGGGVDLAELRRITPALDASDRAISRLDHLLARTIADPWIVTPVRRRLDPLAERAARARYDSATAAMAVRSGRALLGGDGLRRYLVLFTTPAEARGLGGFAGNFAELIAENGQLTIARFGRSEELFPPTDGPGLTITGPPGWASSWARFGGINPVTGKMLQDYWLAITMPPSLSDVGELAAEIYPQVGGSPIDGVIAVDPFGLSALLALTGPINVPSIGASLDSSSVAEYLLRTQYRDFDIKENRVDGLEAVAIATTEALLGAGSALPAPPDIAKILSPAARANHLTMWSRRRDEEALLERIGADNALPPVNGDSLAVVFQSISSSKLDAFTSRSVDYEATVDPTTGEASGDITVTIGNNATETGLPPYVYGFKPATGETSYGEHMLYVTVYTAYPVVSATVDGKATEVWRWSERGRNATTAFIRIRAGRTGKVGFSLRGFLPPDDTYRLAVRAQTSATTPDRYRIRVNAGAVGTLAVEEAIEGVRRFEKPVR